MSVVIVEEAAVPAEPVVIVEESATSAEPVLID
jgi:hypothetical protein